MADSAPLDDYKNTLNDELLRLVGTGRLDVKKYDAAVQRLWAAETKEAVDAVREDYIGAGAGIAGIPAQEFDNLPGVREPVTVSWELKRKGNWTVPAESSYIVKGGELTLDYRGAAFTAPTATVKLEVSWFGSVKVILSPEMGFVDRTTNKWGSDVTLHEPRRPQQGQPTLILEGTITGSTLSVKTKPQKDGFGGIIEDIIGELE